MARVKRRGSGPSASLPTGTVPADCPTQEVRMAMKKKKAAKKTAKKAAKKSKKAAKKK